VTERDVRGLVALLLQVSDPEGETARRLQRIQRLVEEGVFLSASAQRFLEDLRRALVDNMECRHLTGAGGCRADADRPCAHGARYAACALYDPQTPERPQLLQRGTHVR
jgi:hypothetical protein